MHFKILTSPGDSFVAISSSRVIKAEALAEWIATRELSAALESEFRQRERDFRKEADQEREKGYAAGMNEAHAVMATQLILADQFLKEAHACFMTAFSRSVSDAVARLTETLPDADRMQAVIEQSYAAMGRDLALTLAVHPQMWDAASEVMNRLADKILHIGSGPELIADDTLDTGACRLESAVAVVRHDFDAIINGICQAVLRSVKEATLSTAGGGAGLSGADS